LEKFPHDARLSGDPGHFPGRVDCEIPMIRLSIGEKTRMIDRLGWFHRDDAIESSLVSEDTYECCLTQPGVPEIKHFD